MRPLPVMVVAATSVALSLATATVAQAAGSGTTPVTFTIVGGSGLAITAPSGSVSLGPNGSPSGSLNALLGPVTVTDNRTLQVGAGWTATVSSTDYTNNDTVPAVTVPNSRVSYASNLATTTGTGVFTSGGLLPTTSVPFGASAQTAYQARTVVGNNSATWNPTLTVAIPSDAVVGTYGGTVTHSVS